MEHFKDNSGCSGPKKSEIFWNNSRKVQYVFAGAVTVIRFVLIMHFSLNFKQSATILLTWVQSEKRFICSNMVVDAAHLTLTLNTLLRFTSGSSSENAGLKGLEAVGSKGSL